MKYLKSIGQVVSAAKANAITAATEDYINVRERAIVIATINKCYADFAKIRESYEFDMLQAERYNLSKYAKAQSWHSLCMLDSEKDQHVEAELTTRDAHRSKPVSGKIGSMGTCKEDLQMYICITEGEYKLLK